MILFDAALSRMTWRVCNPPLADLGGREERSVFICHHSMMQRPRLPQVLRSIWYGPIGRRRSLPCACSRPPSVFTNARWPRAATKRRRCHAAKRSSNIGRA